MDDKDFNSEQNGSKQDSSSDESTSAPRCKYNGAPRFSSPKKAKHAPTGDGTNPDEYTDTFVIGPFTFYVREASETLINADTAFSDRAINALGLLSRAEREVERDERVGAIRPISYDEREEYVYDRALELLNTESFRVGPNGAKNSRMYDQMVADRYDAILFGIGDDPEEWGGIVTWKGPVAFDRPEELRDVMKKSLKLELYQRIVALSRYGMGDELFRRALGRDRR